VSAVVAPLFLTLPIEPDEGFPQSFRLELAERLYVVALYVNVSEPRLEAAPAEQPLDLGAEATDDAHMVVRVARESELGTPRTIFLRKVVPGIVYAAEDLLLRFDELVVAPANLNAAGRHGSRVRGGVALAWAS
jgi:hypothetical protein